MSTLRHFFSPKPKPQKRLRGRTGGEGQTLVEYVLLLAMLSCLAIVAFGILGTQVTTTFNNINNLLDTAQNSDDG